MMNFKKKDSDEKFDIYLEKGSALIFKDELYTDWLHGIESKQEDELGNQINKPLCENKEGVKKRDLRISITLRYVTPLQK